jgi:hypothetical protein
MYSKVDIKNIKGFLIDNIFVVFGNQIFQQTVGIPMVTKYAPLSVDLFLYSYEADIHSKSSTREELTSCCGLQFNIQI